MSNDVAEYLAMYPELKKQVFTPAAILVNIPAME